MSYNVSELIETEENRLLKDMEIIENRIQSYENLEYQIYGFTVALLVGVLGFSGIIISQTIIFSPLLTLIGFYFVIIVSMGILYGSRHWVHNIYRSKDNRYIAKTCLQKYFFDKSKPLRDIAENPDLHPNDYQLIKDVDSHFKSQQDSFEILNDHFGISEKKYKDEYWWDEFRGFDWPIKSFFYQKLTGKHIDPKKTGLMEIDEIVKKIIIGLGIVGIIGSFVPFFIFRHFFHGYLVTIILGMVVVTIPIVTYILYSKMVELDQKMIITKTDIQAAFNSSKELKQKLVINE